MSSRTALRLEARGGQGGPAPGKDILFGKQDTATPRVEDGCVLGWAVTQKALQQAQRYHSPHQNARPASTLYTLSKVLTSPKRSP